MISKDPRARVRVIPTLTATRNTQVDQASGKRGRADVLIELAQYRRLGGKMHFGALLAESRTQHGGGSGGDGGDGGGGGGGGQREAWLVARFGGRVLAVGARAVAELTQ
jgi:hypothetical protein